MVAFTITVNAERRDVMVADGNTPLLWVCASIWR